ncbi:MAG: hypothetical protein IKC05_03295, partial [Lentisphaeria bacterium]|nr:hypothetical protein [Lentisphaeria bacterium]
SLIEEPKAAEPEKPAAVEEKVKNDDLSGKLENLTAEAVQEKPAPVENKPAVDLSEVDAKLDDLLGNRK